MGAVSVEVAGFLNDDSVEESLGRLGQAALGSGISDAALRSLVKITCRAHNVRVEGLDTHGIDEEHLEEMRSVGLIYRPSRCQVKMV
jgi:hypothetical protein